MADNKFIITDITSDQILKWNKESDAFISDASLVTFKDGVLTSAQSINKNIKLLQSVANIIQNKLPEWVATVFASPEARESVLSALEQVIGDEAVMSKLTALFVANNTFKNALAEMLETNEDFQQVLEKFFENDQLMLNALSKSVYSMLVMDSEFIEDIASDQNLKESLEKSISTDGVFKSAITGEVKENLLVDKDFFTKLAKDYDLKQIFADEFVKNLDTTLKASFEALVSNAKITKLGSKTIEEAFLKVSDTILQLDTLIKSEIVIFPDDSVPELWGKLSITGPSTGYSYYKFNKDIKRLADIIKTIDLGKLTDQTAAGVLAATNTKNSLSLTTSDVTVSVLQTVGYTPLTVAWESLQINSLCVYNNKLYIGNTTSLYTYDGSGEPTSIWKPQHIIDTLCVYNDKLYMYDIRGDIYTYDGSGEPTRMWTPLTNVASLCVYNNKLYMGSTEGYLYISDGNTTPTKISYAIENIHLLCVYNNKLYMCDTNSSLYEYNESGEPTKIWTPPHTIISLCVYNNKLYITQGASLYTYDGSGEPTSIWTPSTDTIVLCVYNNKLYITQGYSLYEYDGSGEPTIVTSQSNIIFRQLCVYNNKLYMGAIPGNLYGISYNDHGKATITAKDLVKYIGSVDVTWE